MAQPSSAQQGGVQCRHTSSASLHPSSWRPQGRGPAQDEGKEQGLGQPPACGMGGQRPVLALVQGQWGMASWSGHCRAPHKSPETPGHPPRPMGTGHATLPELRASHGAAALLSAPPAATQSLAALVTPCGPRPALTPPPGLPCSLSQGASACPMAARSQPHAALQHPLHPRQGALQGPLDPAHQAPHKTHPSRRSPAPCSCTTLGSALRTTGYPHGPAPCLCARACLHPHTCCLHPHTACPGGCRTHGALRWAPIACWAPLVLGKMETVSTPWRAGMWWTLSSGISAPRGAGTGESWLRDA